MKSVKSVVKKLRLLSALLVVSSAVASAAERIAISWPTPNTAFARGLGIADILQHAGSGDPASGGFGCVRTNDTQFHEGIDIKAVGRDRAGEPTDSIFAAMDGLPVVIRLIDPPLHEFLPNLEEQLVKVIRAEAAGGASQEDRDLLATIRSMHEQNPMLGLRGIRLGLMIPDFVKIQTRAILNAAIAVKKAGKDPRPEIMIPLVGHVNELKSAQTLLEAEAKAVVEQAGASIDYKFGTMIEIPRACWVADEIAEYAQFFSFGTNDLTQMTFGYSRDDAEGGFLLKYVEEKILPYNPFQSLDPVIVREMEMAVQLGRKTRPDLKVGICGEHGGDPLSIQYCENVGLNYVSCSPFRVPVARLAAAQAALTNAAERDR